MMYRKKMFLSSLHLAHEMNGNWYPWSLNSTPSDYILAWRRIHNIFSNKSLNSTRLQWIWCVNNADVGSYTAENYWVGNEYVDWLGIDGYNFGSSQSWSSWSWPNQTFDNMIARLRTLSPTKPLSINEYGSTTKRVGNISDISAKTDWLNQFCNYITNKQIIMASCFNEDKETDWANFGGARGDVVWNTLNGYSAYKNCLQSSNWVVPNNTNPRILTDQQFAGVGKINIVRERNSNRTSVATTM